MEPSRRIRKKPNKKQRPKLPQDRREGDPAREEYRWLDGVNSAGGPTNPTGVPPGIQGCSANPDILAWVRSICKFG